MDLDNIKGLGVKTKQTLNKANIYTINDLLSYYPYKYLILKPDSLDGDKNAIISVNATVASVGKVSYLRKNFNILKFMASSYGKMINVTIFNRAFLNRNLTLGREITLIGKYDNNKNMFTASDIKLSKMNGESITPYYHNINGLKNSNIISLINEILKSKLNYMEYIPEYLNTKYKLISKNEAIHNIHNPKNTIDIKAARRKLIYEELFVFMFKMMYLKELKDKSVGICKNIDFNKVKDFISNLPFALTKDQINGIKAGLKDMSSEKRMNRLLIGDVGSGKTIVAIVLMYANSLAGYQSAFLAPTEILAIQHYNNMKKLNLNVALLTGKNTLKEKNVIYKKLENNEIDIIVGTHAILNDKIKFNNLGLFITDEQHRFGVSQREFLSSKGESPDMMFMSATPIPRTYALTIFADMDLTEIREKPQGRKDIITKVYKENELKIALEGILNEVKMGHQIYVVSPSINSEDESLMDVNILKDKFNMAFHEKIPLGVLHGKLKNNEKEDIMNRFLNGEIKILISTTVIEVGVDNPNATVICVFNAERFGLATLHQLRGRVGRNSLNSYCYLICNQDIERLHILEESNDGFYISEKDFQNRGGGDLLGDKQSGDMTFKIADLKRDYNILKVAKDDVINFIDKKEYLNNKLYLDIIDNIDLKN